MQTAVMAKCTTSKLELPGLRSRNPACLLVCAAMVMVMVSCQPRSNSGIETFGAVSGSTAHPAAGEGLDAAVNNARVTDHIATSTLESKDAGQGNTFVVLDVSVRNTDAQPQVFSEGKLVDVTASHERAFATPVTMLTDDFLSLQVIPPNGRVRGKIAYEVPENMTGALYWIPGNGSKRIPLHPDTPAVAVATLGSADAPEQALVETHAGAHIDAPTPTPVRGTSPPRSERSVTAVPPTGNTHDAHRSVATRTTPTARDAPHRNEPARTQACQALLLRNDPAEKARYLGFFARQCPDYAMPSTWTQISTAGIPSPDPADAGPSWPPRSGPAFDCSQAWTRAEHLVCQDAVLSLMDWELARAYGNASRVVENPAALQRDEDDWRHRVRDACDNARCIEMAYERRTALLESVSQAR